MTKLPSQMPKHLSLIILGYSILSCQPKTSFNLFENKQFIEWHRDHPLEYQNFKAKVKPLPMTHPLITAATASGIYYQVQKDFKFIIHGKANTIIVKSYFDSATSWFGNAHKTQNILEHEQIHFDITELFARKLKKELLEKFSKPIGLNQLVREYNIIADSMHFCQNEYDKAVRLDRNMQQYWLLKVQTELKLLERYKDDTISITSK